MQTELIVLEYIKVFIWPITLLLILIVFRKQIKNIFERIHKADFPGGISFETFPDKIDKAKELSDKVLQEEKDNKDKRKSTIPLNEVNAKMLNLELSPSPSGLDLNYYRELAEKDPVIALAGLRIELESMLKNLAKGWKVGINKSDGAYKIARKLKENGAITNNQLNLIQSILKLSNAAVHGIKVTYDQAEEILEIAEVLKDQFVNWLSWGFNKN